MLAQCTELYVAVPVATFVDRANIVDVCHTTARICCSREHILVHQHCKLPLSIFTHMQPLATMEPSQSFGLSHTSLLGDSIEDVTVQDHSEEQDDVKHPRIGTFVAYCFTVNYILGVGVLGQPKAFYAGGYILSAIALLLVTSVAICTALWLVDIGIRVRHTLQRSALIPSSTDLPPTRVLEVNELIEQVLGWKVRKFYEAVLIFYIMGSLWSYSAVFAESLTKQIGIPGLNDGYSCDIYHDSSAACFSLYRVYIGLFSCVAIPLCCLQLTEMKGLQIVLAIFRFVALALMICTSIAAIYSYPLIRPMTEQIGNVTITIGDPNGKAPYYSDIRAFDFSGLAAVFPTAIFAQIFHHSIPGIATVSN